MSQVKNLRAMFETKGDDPSPPDRGRSPGAPWPGTFAGIGVVSSQLPHSRTLSSSNPLGDFSACPFRTWAGALASLGLQIFPTCFLNRSLPEC